MPLPDHSLYITYQDLCLCHFFVNYLDLCLCRIYLIKHPRLAMAEAQVDLVKKQVEEGEILEKDPANSNAGPSKWIRWPTPQPEPLSDTGNETENEKVEVRTNAISTPANKQPKLTNYFNRKAPLGQCTINKNRSCHSTPKRKRTVTADHTSQSAPVFQFNNTLNDLLYLADDVTIVSPPHKRGKPSAELEYKTKVEKAIQSIDYCIQNAQNKFVHEVTSTQKVSDIKPTSEINTVKRTYSEVLVSQQGFAENSLPKDVQGTWRNMRGDVIDGGKNKIRGEWLLDATAIKHREPWTLGTERPPAYISKEKEIADFITQTRKESADKIMSFAGKFLLEKYHVQKKSAARNKVTVESAIDEEAASPEEAAALKKNAQDAIDKLVDRETNKEMKLFNEKSAGSLKNKVNDPDILDPFGSIMRNKNRPSENSYVPFQEGGPMSHTSRGRMRGRGRGARRPNRPYPSRGGRPFRGNYY